MESEERLLRQSEDGVEEEPLQPVHRSRNPDEDGPDFRLRFSKPKLPIVSDATQKLAQPKQQKRVDDKFQYADFRGMIHADYTDAVINVTGQATHLDENSLQGVNDETNMTLTHLIERKQ